MRWSPAIVVAIAAASSASSLLIDSGTAAPAIHVPSPSYRWGLANFSVAGQVLAVDVADMFGRELQAAAAGRLVLLTDYAAAPSVWTSECERVGCLGVLWHAVQYRGDAGLQCLFLWPQKGGSLTRVPAVGLDGDDGDRLAAALRADPNRTVTIASGDANPAAALLSTPGVRCLFALVVLAAGANVAALVTFAAWQLAGRNQRALPPNACWIGAIVGLCSALRAFEAASFALFDTGAIGPLPWSFLAWIRTASVNVEFLATFVFMCDVSQTYADAFLMATPAQVDKAFRGTKFLFGVLLFVDQASSVYYGATGTSNAEDQSLLLGALLIAIRAGIGAAILHMARRLTLLIASERALNDDLGARALLRYWQRCRMCASCMVGSAAIATAMLFAIGEALGAFIVAQCLIGASTSVVSSSLLWACAGGMLDVPAPSPPLVDCFRRSRARDDPRALLRTNTATSTTTA